MHDHDIHHFLDCLTGVYTQAKINVPQYAEDFEILIKALEYRKLTPNHYLPAKIPVCRYLQTAYEALVPGNPLVKALGVILPKLHWVHKYDVDDNLPGFSNNYAHTEIMGPKGLVHDDTCKFGLILIGPDLYYPNHRHLGVELYLLLSGTSKWKMDKEDWTIRQSGDYIYHPSNINHAMQTLDEPVLALYAWHGDITSPVSFSEGNLEGVMYPEHMK